MVDVNSFNMQLQHAAADTLIWRMLPCQHPGTLPKTPTFGHLFGEFGPDFFGSLRKPPILRSWKKHDHFSPMTIGGSSGLQEVDKIRQVVFVFPRRNPGKVGVFNRYLSCI